MVPDWFRAKRPSGSALLAYVNLGSFGTFKPGPGIYDECRPSLPRLAEEMGVSESTARRALAELVDLGAAIRIPRFNKDGSPAPTMYRLVFLQPSAAAQGVVSPVEPPPVTRDTRGGVTGGTRVVSPVTGNQEPSTHNQNTKNHPSIDDSAGASSSDRFAADDEARRKTEQPKRRNAGRYVREQQRAREILDSIGYQFHPDETAAFLRWLREVQAVANPGAYCQGIVDNDGEDKLADLVYDAWVVMQQEAA